MLTSTEEANFEATLILGLIACDDYTRMHTRRVALYSVEIGYDMGLSSAEIERLEQAALLHDIGKVGIDLDILQKRGPLSQEELRKIQQHTLIGARILEGVPFLGESREIIKQHHEWFNGQGYPFGLCGEEILLEARIIAVADAFDAMTTKRPYRTAMTYRAALDEIASLAEIQFDPDVVCVFLRMCEEKEKEYKAVFCTGSTRNWSLLQELIANRVIDLFCGDSPLGNRNG